MKSKKRLKLILIILICLLISLIGFIGIYTKTTNKYSNKIPDYKLASDLKGATVLELEVDTGTNTIYYDKEGKKVNSSEVTEDNKSQYTSEEQKVNSAEVLNAENYEKTLAILKERLKFLQVDQYNLDLDKKTGKMMLTFEDEYPEDIESILPMEGKLELVDSNTTDVILDDADVTSAEATYASTENGYTVYLALKLTEDGITKVNDLERYKKSTDEEGQEIINKFKVQFDEEQIEEVSYDDIVLTGKTLRITIANNITSNTTINSKMNTATVVSKLATIGKTPVVYNISAEEYVKTSVNMNIFYGVVIATIVVVAIVCIYFITKYKTNGILATIATIANIALFTILIRLTNITISLNSFAGIVALIIVNMYLVNNILKALKNTDKTFGENLKEAYLKSIDVLLMSLMIFAVFAFSKMTVISSMGLLLFWGWLVVVLGNLLLTVPMLKIGGKE